MHRLSARFGVAYLGVTLRRTQKKCLFRLRSAGAHLFCVSSLGRASFAARSSCLPERGRARVRAAL
jgi:hypothetical protein